MPKKKQPGESRHPANNPNVMGLHAAVVEQPITDTLETNYMPYAMSVIVSRAIPCRNLFGHYEPGYPGTPCRNVPGYPNPKRKSVVHFVFRIPL